MSTEARARELGDQALAGNRLALARLLTAVENRTPVAEAALRRLYPQGGRAHVVGITGPPGAGKSTLVSALIAEARASGRVVGVVAVDPSSPITGGALLGDRVRMQAYAGDADVFIRSMASRGHAGGLASTSAAAAAVLDAVGFDLILLETVGTGQSEVEVAASADTTVVIEAPEMGDEVQAIKAGLLEVADIVVVNKGDRPGAQRTAAQLRAMLTSAAKIGQESVTSRHHGAHLPPPVERGEAGAGAGSDAGPASRPDGRLRSDGRLRPKQPQVLVTTALTGAGVPELLAAIDRRAGASGDSARARAVRAEAQVWSILGDRLRSRLDVEGRREEAAAILASVADHGVDPFAAADRLLELVAREASIPAAAPGAAPAMPADPSATTGGGPRLVALGARVHLFVRPSERDGFIALFRDVLGCDARELDFGLEHPILLVTFQDGSAFSAEFSELAPAGPPPGAVDDEHALRGPWIEFRTSDLEANLARLRQAGVPEFRHRGGRHAYFAAPGGQVFRLLDLGYRGP